MLTLLLALAAPLAPAPPVTYQVRLQIISGTDTVATTFVVAEGVEGRAVIEGRASFTRVRVRVTPAKTNGCLDIRLGSVRRETLEAADQAAIDPIPLIQLCGTTTARASVGDGPLHVLSVREVPDSE